MSAAARRVRERGRKSHGIKCAHGRYRSEDGISSWIAPDPLVSRAGPRGLTGGPSEPRCPRSRYP